MTRRGFRRLLPGLAAVGLLISGCSAGEAEDGGMAEAPSPEAEVEAAPDPEPEAEEEPGGPVDPALAEELAGLIREELPPVNLYASNAINNDCEHEASGCYVNDEPAIYLDAEITDFRRPELLAHEYLHYIWQRDDLESDTDLASALQQAFDDPEGLGALIPTWQSSYFDDDGQVAPTELFSYACTGLRTDQLPAVAGQRCETYLNVDALPINQHINESELLDQIDSLRREQGVAQIENNPHAAGASRARADLFTPHSQVPLDEYPDSVRDHLDAGCAPAKYGALLTRPHDLEQISVSLDQLLDGALTSPEYTGIGIATNEYDFIDASAIFGERTVQVNATLLVVTVCE